MWPSKRPSLSFVCWSIFVPIANNSFSHQQIRVVKPSLNNQIQGISYHQNFSQLPNNYKADIIFICIKPQNSEIILKELSQTKIFDEDTIFVSTLAGKKINFFLKIFSIHQYHHLMLRLLVKSLQNLDWQEVQ